MADGLKKINERCGTTHTLEALSVTSATISGVLMLFTIPLNGVIIYCLLKERKTKFKALFYKLLLNIAFADLMTGLITDSSSVNFLVKEAMGVKLKLIDVYMIHVSLFLSDAVALITTILLSIDRIALIVTPVRHFNGIKTRTENIIIFLTWPLGMLLVVPYFEIHYIKQLIVFSVVNIGVALAFLIITVTIYRRRTGSFCQTKPLQRRIITKMAFSNVFINRNTFDYNRNKDNDISQKEKPNDGKKIFTLTKNGKIVPAVKSFTESKATKAFLITLVVFIVTYLPTCFTMSYMNACANCNCIVIHAMRDVSSISIKFSSVLRPITFIATLKRLRKSLIKIRQ